MKTRRKRRKSTRPSCVPLPNTNTPALTEVQELQRPRQQATSYASTFASANLRIQGCRRQHVGLQTPKNAGLRESRALRTKSNAPFDDCLLSQFHAVTKTFGNDRFPPVTAGEVTVGVLAVFSDYRRVAGCTPSRRNHRPAILPSLAEVPFQFANPFLHIDRIHLSLACSLQRIPTPVLQHPHGSVKKVP